MIKQHNIDICCLQEIDVKKDYNVDILSFKGYTLLRENNTVKSRCGVYIKESMKFTRRSDLEGVDNGLVILDVELKVKYRVVNVYRIFKPMNWVTEKNYFINQLSLIKAAIENCQNKIPIMLGDFNLNEEKKSQDKLTILNHQIII